MKLLKLLIGKKMRGELGMVGHTSNARTLEAEAGGLRAQGHPQLQSRFKPA